MKVIKTDSQTSKLSRIQAVQATSHERFSPVWYNWSLVMENTVPFSIFTASAHWLVHHGISWYIIFNCTVVFTCLSYGPISCSDILSKMFFFYWLLEDTYHILSHFIYLISKNQWKKTSPCPHQSPSISLRMWPSPSRWSFPVVLFHEPPRVVRSFHRDQLRRLELLCNGFCWSAASTKPQKAHPLLPTGIWSPASSNNSNEVSVCSL
jgi:hypothetical protein